MPFSRKPAWALLVAGLVIYLMPALAGALLAGLGVAALFVSEETYRKRKRQAASLLSFFGLHRPGPDERA
jgi:Flp pilus assembly protein TadB